MKGENFEQKEIETPAEVAASRILEHMQREGVTFEEAFATEQREAHHVHPDVENKFKEEVFGILEKIKNNKTFDE